MKNQSSIKPVRLAALFLLAAGVLLAPAVSFNGIEAPGSVYAKDKHKSHKHAHEVRKLKKERNHQIEKAHEQYEHDVRKAKEVHKRSKRAERLDQARKNYHQKVKAAVHSYTEQRAKVDAKHGH